MPWTPGDFLTWQWTPGTVGSVQNKLGASQPRASQEQLWCRQRRLKCWPACESHRTGALHPPAHRPPTTRPRAVSFGSFYVLKSPLDQTPQKIQPKNNTHVFCFSPFPPNPGCLTPPTLGAPQPRARVHCRPKPPSPDPAPGPCKSHGTSVLSLEPIVCYLGRGPWREAPPSPGSGPGAARGMCLVNSGW